MSSFRVNSLVGIAMEAVTPLLEAVRDYLVGDRSCGECADGLGSGIRDGRIQGCNIRFRIGIRDSGFGIRDSRFEIRDSGFGLRG